MSKQKAGKTATGKSKPILVTAPESQYRNFLNAHIVPNLPKKNRLEVKKWSDVDLENDPDKIVDEIAKKFNERNTLGIGSASYVRGSGQPNYYEGATQTGKTKMTLAPPPGGKVGSGPNPVYVGHELVHANDHQIDFLNPLVWSHLGTLATTGGNQGAPMSSFDEFERSIGKIQDKINPGGEFRPDPAYPESGYPFNPDYIETEMSGATDKPYKVPLYNVNGPPDWPTLFQNISSVVNSPPTGTETVPNQGFYLNRASEFPAYMSERLTLPWGTASGPNPLSVPEATFVHSTLRDMGEAYPFTNYPTTNKHIMERARSVERAYPNSFPSTRIRLKKDDNGGYTVVDTLQSPLVSSITPSAPSASSNSWLSHAIVPDNLFSEEDDY